MKKISFIFFVLFLLQVTAQAEISIVDVRRNIPLSEEDPVYRDYILNAGEGSGLKKNLVVQAKRKILVRDSSTKSIGQVETVVGQLRIIHVDKKVAVAREYKLTAREDEVMLEQIGFMTGDSIDLTGSFTDSKPIKRMDREPSNHAALGADAVSTQREKNAPSENETTQPKMIIKSIPLAIPEI